MGSSAATSTAVCKALSNYLGVDLEKIKYLNLFLMLKNCHRIPSGIDNTVVAYESPSLLC